MFAQGSTRNFEKEGVELSTEITQYCTWVWPLIRAQTGHGLVAILKNPQMHRNTAINGGGPCPPRTCKKDDVHDGGRNEDAGDLASGLENLNETRSYAP